MIARRVRALRSMHQAQSHHNSAFPDGGAKVAGTSVERRRTRCVLQLLFALVALLIASPVAADPPLPPGEEKRPRPDYEGRPPEPPTPGQRLMVIPQVILYPVYLTTEYLIRKPVGAAVRFAEEYHLVARWHDLFTFGPEQEIGLYPSASIDVGLRPSAGVYFFWKNIVPRNRLNVRVLTGGPRVWLATTEWIASSRGSSKLDIYGRFTRRPDRSYYGTGPESDYSPTRYDEQRTEARLAYSRTIAKYTKLQTYLGLDWVVFNAERGELSGPTLAQAIADGTLPAPPALDSGFLAPYTGLLLQYDNRPSLLEIPLYEPNPARRGGSGVAFETRVEHHTGLYEARSQAGDPGRLPHWLDYGVRVTGSLDLTGTQRRLDLIAMGRFTEALLVGSPVPFTEQASLGGSQPLRGFAGRRLLDLSATALTLRYAWPVHEQLSGDLHYAVGNVFGSHLDGFELGLLRSSFGIGVSSPDAGDPFEAMVAFGTETFAEGGGIEHVRLVFGTSAGL